MVRSRIGSPPAEAPAPHPTHPGGHVAGLHAPRPQVAFACGRASDAIDALAPAAIEPPESFWSRLLATFRRGCAHDAGADRAAREPRPFRFVLEIFGQRTRSLALGCVLALGGCSGERVEVEGVVRDGRTGRPIAGARVSTPDGRSTETDAEGRFAVEVEEGSARAVIARAEDHCDVTEHVDVRRPTTPRVTLNLFEALELDTERTQVGFDADVRIEVRARCDAGGPLRWEQISGPRLDEEDLRIEEDGYALVLHTHALEELVQLDPRPSVVALDRARRAEYRLRLTTPRATRVVRVVAAPTSAGLYQVATGADVYLNGGEGEEHAWAMLSRPEHSAAELSDPTGRTTRFRPDRFGTYLVEHRPSSTQMSIQAGAYEDVPRDCGREGCHQAEDTGWTETAHARTFERGLSGELGEEFSERCWSCHATGVDQGLENGGLHQTAARVGWAQPAPGPEVWDAAPRRVRRHGAVWCSACHGPGRIVPPPFRWQYGAKFGVGVCARCHDVDADDPDANHVSPHVDEWELARMSAFVRDLREDDPALRRECARCHSAQGFVAWRRGAAPITPDRDTVASITCATCHDAHDASRPFALRVYDVADPVYGAPAEHLGSGALCATCHRTEGGLQLGADAAPHASHTEVLLGRGARVREAAGAEADDAPHRLISDTCVRCHMARPAEDDALYGTAGGHTFSVRARRGEPTLMRAACVGCHGDVDPASIGARDWDGDGTPGPVGEEHDRAFARAASALRAAIAARRIESACGRVAVDVVDHDARLVLVDEAGVPIGDCDADGQPDEEEVWLGAGELPAPVRDAAWDVALLRSDGSRGAHNAAFAFRVLAGVQRSLQ